MKLLFDIVIWFFAGFGFSTFLAEIIAPAIAKFFKEEE